LPEKNSQISLFLLSKPWTTRYVDKEQMHNRLQTKLKWDKIPFKLTAALVVITVAALADIKVDLAAITAVAALSVASLVVIKVVTLAVITVTATKTQKQKHKLQLYVQPTPRRCLLPSL
jgi:hypothetical protein